ncbi:KRE33 [Symbiodinium sp. CCMP2592]|nr:KRE33 [Symbiodinium sp. CCMP2592]
MEETLLESEPPPGLGRMSSEDGQGQPIGHCLSIVPSLNTGSLYPQQEPELSPPKATEAMANPSPTTAGSPPAPEQMAAETQATAPPALANPSPTPALPEQTNPSPTTAGSPPALPEQTNPSPTTTGSPPALPKQTNPSPTTTGSPPALPKQTNPSPTTAGSPPALPKQTNPTLSPTTAGSPPALPKHPLLVSKAHARLNRTRPQELPSPPKSPQAPLLTELHAAAPPGLANPSPTTAGSPPAPPKQSLLQTKARAPSAPPSATPQQELPVPSLPKPPQAPPLVPSPTTAGSPPALPKQILLLTDDGHGQPSGHSLDEDEEEGDSERPKTANEKELEELKATTAEAVPLGPIVAASRTLDQAKAVMSFVDAISEKSLNRTMALTAARGRGKSAALGLAISAAVAYGYSNIFVTAPSPENLSTVFEFILKGFDALGMKEHQEYELVQAENPELNKALVRVNIFKDHRQTVQYISPSDWQHLAQAELLVVDEAAAIPLPIVKKLLGPYLVLLASTVNGYEGTGRALSLKLIEDLKAGKGVGGSAKKGILPGSKVVVVLPLLRQEDFQGEGRCHPGGRTCVWCAATAATTRDTGLPVFWPLDNLPHLQDGEDIRSPLPSKSKPKQARFLLAKMETLR